MDVEEGTAYQEELKLCQLKIADAFFTLWGNKSILFNKFRTRACFMNIERVVILSTLKNYFVGFMEAVLFFRIIQQSYIDIFRHTSFNCALLHCTSQILYCVWHQLKVCGNLALSESTGAIFPRAFAHFVSLCHIVVILPVFQSLHQKKHLWLAEGSDDGEHFSAIHCFKNEVCTWFL